MDPTWNWANYGQIQAQANYYAAASRQLRNGSSGSNNGQTINGSGTQTHTNQNQMSTYTQNQMTPWFALHGHPHPSFNASVHQANNHHHHHHHSDPPGFSANPFSFNPTQTSTHHPGVPSYDPPASFLTGFQTAAAAAAAAKAANYLQPSANFAKQISAKDYEMNLRAASFAAHSHCGAIQSTTHGASMSHTDASSLSTGPGSHLFPHLTPTSWRHHPNLMASHNHNFSRTGAFGPLPHEETSLMQTRVSHHHNSNLNQMSSSATTTGGQTKSCAIENTTKPLQHHTKHNGSNVTGAGSSSVTAAAAVAANFFNQSVHSTNNHRSSMSTFEPHFSSQKLSHNQSQSDHHHFLAMQAAAAAAAVGMSATTSQHMLSNARNSTQCQYPSAMNFPGADILSMAVASTPSMSKHPSLAAVGSTNVNNNTNNQCHIRNTPMMTNNNYCNLMMSNMANMASAYSQQQQQQQHSNIISGSVNNTINSVVNSSNSSNSNNSTTNNNSRSSSVASNHNLQQNESSSGSFGYNSPSTNPHPNSPYQQVTRNNSSSQVTPSSTTAVVGSSNIITNGLQDFSTANYLNQSNTNYVLQQQMQQSVARIDYPTPPSSAQIIAQTVSSSSQGQDDSLSHFSSTNGNAQQTIYPTNSYSPYSTASGKHNSNNGPGSNSSATGSSSCMVEAAARAAAAVNCSNSSSNNSTTTTTGTTTGYHTDTSDADACLSNIVNVTPISDEISDMSKLNDTQINTTLSDVLNGQGIDFQSINYQTGVEQNFNQTSLRLDNTGNHISGSNLNKKKVKTKKSKKKDKLLLKDHQTNDGISIASANANNNSNSANNNNNNSSNNSLSSFNLPLHHFNYTESYNNQSCDAGNFAVSGNNLHTNQADNLLQSINDVTTNSNSNNSNNGNNNNNNHCQFSSSLNMQQSLMNDSISLHHHHQQQQQQQQQHRQPQVTADSLLEFNKTESTQEQSHSIVTHPNESNSYSQQTDSHLISEKDLISDLEHDLSILAEATNSDCDTALATSMPISQHSQQPLHSHHQQQQASVQISAHNHQQQQLEPSQLPLSSDIGTQAGNSIDCASLHSTNSLHTSSVSTSTDCTPLINDNCFQQPSPGFRNSSTSIDNHLNATELNQVTITEQTSKPSSNRNSRKNNNSSSVSQLTNDNFQANIYRFLNNNSNDNSSDHSLTITPVVIKTTAIKVSDVNTMVTSSAASVTLSLPVSTCIESISSAFSTNTTTTTTASTTSRKKKTKEINENKSNNFVTIKQSKLNKKDEMIISEKKCLTEQQQSVKEKKFVNNSNELLTITKQETDVNNAVVSMKKLNNDIKEQHEGGKFFKASRSSFFSSATSIVNNLSNINNTSITLSTGRGNGSTIEKNSRKRKKEDTSMSVTRLVNPIDEYEFPDSPNSKAPTKKNKRSSSNESSKKKVNNSLINQANVNSMVVTTTAAAPILINNNNIPKPAVAATSVTLALNSPIIPVTRSNKINSEKINSTTAISTMATTNLITSATTAKPSINSLEVKANKGQKKNEATKAKQSVANVSAAIAPISKQSENVNVNIVNTKDLNLKTSTAITTGKGDENKKPEIKHSDVKPSTKENKEKKQQNKNAFVNNANSNNMNNNSNTIKLISTPQPQQPIKKILNNAIPKVIKPKDQPIVPSQLLNECIVNNVTSLISPSLPVPVTSTAVTTTPSPPAAVIIATDSSESNSSIMAMTINSSAATTMTAATGSNNKVSQNVAMQSAGTNTPRRRSQDKKALTIREGLMRTGDFVVSIDEMNYELPMIWRIEGKSLLQRFEPSKQDTMIVYTNTSSYSAWNPTVRQRYTGVDVRVMGCSRTKIVVEKLGLTKTNLSNVNGDVTIVEKCKMNLLDTTYQHQENFEVFIQTLISQALDPNFIAEIVKENDEYFLSHVQAIDEYCNRKKSRFFSKVKWDAQVVKCVETHSAYTITPQSNVGDLRCRLCHDNWSTQIMNFSGDPYDQMTLEFKSPIDVKQTKYAACDQCKEKVVLFSKLHHQKFNFYMRCKEKVDEMRAADENKESHIILEQCLQDTEWIQVLFKQLEQIWLECDDIR